MGVPQSKPPLDSRKQPFKNTLFEPSVDDALSKDKYNEERQLAFLEYVRSLAAREKNCENGVKITAGRFANTCTTVRPLGSGGAYIFH